MFSKDQFLDVLANETRVCQHLHKKFTEDQMDFSPGQGMRTSLELMQYLGYCAAGSMSAIVHDDWNSFGPRIEKASSMTAEEFPACMDAQLAECHEIMSGLSTEDLTTRTVKLPWGEEGKLGSVLIRTSLSFLTAYRMQLFVYAKAAGHTGLSTYDCWMGVDAPAAT